MLKSQAESGATDSFFKYASSVGGGSSVSVVDSP